MSWPSLENPNSTCAVTADYLEPSEKQRWLRDEPVVYIGCTTRALSKRVGEFYRHQYGKTAPHRGGQAVKLLKCNLWVDRSPATDPFETELTMLCAFKGKVGHLPFANRLSRTIG